MTADRIAPGLYVGSLADAADADTLRAAGIVTVVRLTHTPPEDGYPDGVSVRSHPMTDGPRNDFEGFAAAVETVLVALDGGERTLVHCSVGASRSVSVAAAALAIREGIGIREAFRRVGEARTAADPHPALVRRAARFLADGSRTPPLLDAERRLPCEEPSSVSSHPTRRGTPALRYSPSGTPDTARAD